MPTRTGFVQRSAGTSNRALARKMSAIVLELKDKRQWSLLDAIRERRLSVAQLYDHFASNTLDALRAELSDADVVRHIDAWEASVRATRGDTGTAEMYRWQVERFTGAHMLVSELTPAKITAWLAGLEVTPGTARKNLYALSSFTRYLRTIGVLDRNPLELVSVPKKNPPRMRYESLEIAQPSTARNR